MRHALFLGDFSQQDWCYSEIHFFANTSLKYVSLLSRAGRTLFTSLLTNTPNGGIIGVDWEVIVVKIWPLLDIVSDDGKPDFVVSGTSKLFEKHGSLLWLIFFTGLFLGILIHIIYRWFKDPPDENKLPNQHENDTKEETENKED